jgi:chromosome segregation ATPase
MSNRWDRALSDHRKEIEETSDSYEDYIRELRRTERVQYALALGEALLTGNYASVGDALEELYNRTRELSEEELKLTQVNAEFYDGAYEVEWAVRQVAEAEEDAAAQAAVLDQRMNDLSSSLRGAVGREVESFNEDMQSLQERAGNLRAEIAELEGQRWLSTQQKQDLADLRGELGETQQAIIDTKEEHREAMNAMIWDMARARAAADGFSEAEVDLLTQLANDLGLIDQDTADTIDSMNRAWSRFVEGEASLEETSASMRVLAEDASGLRTNMVQAFRDADQELSNMTGGLDEVNTRWAEQRSAFVRSQMEAQNLITTEGDLITQTDITREHMEDLARTVRDEVPDEKEIYIHLPNRDYIIESLKTMDATLKGLSQPVNIRIRVQKDEVKLPGAYSAGPGTATATVPAESRQAGGYASAGLYYLGERGNEFVLSADAVSQLEGLVGAPLSEREIVQQAAGGPAVAGNTQVFQLNVTTHRELFSLQHEYEVMQALAGV